MRKLFNQIIFCCILVFICWLCFLIRDRHTLNSNLIRFHVVANSDSIEDQSLKLKVRDAVLNSLQFDLKGLTNIADAKTYLHENLPKIQKLVDQTLTELGYPGNAKVTLCKEVFDIRHYDTFSLPAGVYHSLRIIIGEGQGKNWWCVSFPSLCLPATTAGFSDTAVSAGFSAPLVKSLSGNENYEIHFFFLNQLGKLENILFQE